MTYWLKNNFVQVFDIENSMAHKVVVDSDAFFGDSGSFSNPSVKVTPALNE